MTRTAVTHGDEPLLVADQVVVEYPGRGFRKPPFKALHDVSLSIRAGGWRLLVSRRIVRSRQASSSLPMARRSSVA